MYIILVHKFQARLDWDMGLLAERLLAQGPSRSVFRRQDPSLKAALLLYLT